MKWTAGEAGTALGAAAFLGLTLGIGIDVFTQEVAQLGLGNVLLGAKLGLGGLALGEVSRWALEGAAIGASVAVVGIAVSSTRSVAHSVVDFGRGIKDKLTRKRNDGSTPPKAPSPKL